MNLIPEKRTDKNGVTRTKWVKPATAGKPSSSVPAVRLETQKPFHVTNEVLIDLITSERFPSGINAPQVELIKKSLDMVREDDPYVLALAEHLMTSGNERARSVAAEHLYGSALGIMEAIEKVKYDPASYPYGWKAECAWGEELKAVLISGWSLGSVIEESGITLKDEEDEFSLVDHVKDLHSDLSNDDREMHRRQDYEYWRGIAILVVAERETGGVAAENQKPSEFIEWAGTRGDVKAIVELVAERKNLDPEHLSDIMKSKASTSAPLRNGTL